MLGICFRTLFDPNIAHTPHVLETLHSPEVSLRVTILNPNSNAAIRRAEIEIGGTTLDDIDTTIQHSLVSTVQTRMTRLLDNKTLGFETLMRSYQAAVGDEKDALLVQIMHLVKLYVHTYEDVDPIIFIMGFSDSMFAEQYSFGRVDDIVPFGGCIGKYVPVIQYDVASSGYRFFKQHFEYMWEQYSSDATAGIVGAAADTLPL